MRRRAAAAALMFQTMLPGTAFTAVLPAITSATASTDPCGCGRLLVLRQHLPAVRVSKTTNRKRPFTCRHSVGTDVDDIEGSVSRSVAKEVKASRYFRHLGILAGTGLFLTSALLGSLIGIVDPAFILALVIGASACFYVNTQRFNEESEPLPNSSFEVRESTIPGAGLGLFAAEAIPPNKYLFAYEGERLDEDVYFNRYPDGQGRYVAVIDEQLPVLPLVSMLQDDRSTLRGTLEHLSEPTYVDGIDESKSNLARFMNSNSNDPNIRWTKQRFGKQCGTMHFYTIDEVEVGEELLFDYGSNYWDAVQD